MLSQLLAMVNRQFLVHLLLVLALLGSARAAWGLPNNSFSLNHFSSINKIPGESVQCVFEDHLGLLWMGIESTGLVKFDGKNYTIYQNSPDDLQSISSNYPTKIYEDLEGAIWVATPNGLNKLNRSTGLFQRFQFDADDSLSLSSNTINDILPDPLGRLWLATANGVSIYLPSEDRFFRFLHNHDADNPAANNEVSDLHMDKKGNIWIGTVLNGLFRVEPKTYQAGPDEWTRTIHDFSDDPDSKIKRWKNRLRQGGINAIRFITSNREADTLWVAGQSGLHYFSVNEERFHHFTFRQPGLRHLNFCTYLSLLIDKEDKLWAGSSNDGLVMINLKSTDQIAYLNAAQYNSNQLKSNAIREIMESRSGLIWISTKFGGLHYYDKRQNTFALLRAGQRPGEGLSNDFVLTAMEDSRGYLWVGTKGGGLNHYDRSTETFDVYGTEWEGGGLRSTRIECLAEDQDGQLWVGSANGIWSTSVLKPENFIRHHNLHARNFFLEDSAWLWIGTTNGLYRFSLKEKKMSPLPTQHKEFFDAESNIGITRVLKDPEGVLWIATSNNGLFEYHAHNDSLVNHQARPNTPGTLSGNQVRALHIDHKGRFWIGTKSDGLNLFDPESRQFRSMSNPELLPSNSIYHIVEDEEGMLWMGTHSGISRYNPKKERFENFGSHHGLQGLIYEINAHAKTADGLILMGGAGGLNIFEPSAIKYQAYQAPLVLSRLEVFNQVRAIDINHFESFTLDYNSNYISFEFALLDFTKPDENIYSYRLEPFDEEWISAGNRNFATYTNLPPGSYRFMVKGANNDEIWSPEALELEIIIPAPIWKQAWFMPALIILGLAIIALSWYLKINTAKRRERILRQEVEARTHDLFEAYNKLEESNQQVEKHNRVLRRQRDRISRQNLELKIHRQNLELMVADRTRDLEEALQKAEESDRLKSAFLANMSHEIRTPLNAIMGFIDLLEADEFDNEERARINNIIQTNSNALLQLINDIIDISIIEANQLVIKKQQIDFHQFLDDLKLHYQSNKELKDKSVRLIRQFPEENETLFLHTDKGRVWQIFSNLINNAIKFTEKGSISFGYEPNPENPAQLRCFVKDTGIGISAANQQKLFQRFHKIEPLNSKVHRGTGLGLSISKHLCELLGGRIWMESETGKGSTFYFTLPLDN